MMMRTLFIVAALVAALLGGVANAEQKVTKGPVVSIRRTDVPASGYTNVGGNPRGRSVEGWADAVQYMQSAAYRNDIEERLIQGVPPSFRPIYKAKLIPELYRIIRLAAENRYMCGGRPPADIERELRSKFDRVRIEPGTFYLAVTEGQGGGAKARVNRVFRDERCEYFAYRICVEVAIKRFASEAEKKIATVYAKTFFDLIVKCRNTGLGEIKEWEVDTVEVKVPTTNIEYKEVSTRSSAIAQAEAESHSEAEAEARAVAKGGNAVVNNYAPKPELSYHRPEASTYESSTYRAGGLTVQAVPVVKATAKQFQQQQQSQWQDQFLKFWQEIINQNINNIGVGVKTS